ncbi:MAG: nucleotide exchange factor GrpE [bacterium]|nr:nucleotide exchange factor GrpE [bacterium]
MEQDTQEEVNNDESEFDTCQAERDEYLDGWKRAKADYLNLEKSLETRVTSAKNNAEVKILKDFLELADAFDQAFLIDPPDSPWVEGIKQTREKLHATLAKCGVVAIGTDGQKFDPNQHEAVEVVDTEEEDKDDDIIEEVQGGYAIKDRILRPSRVKVAKYKQE